MVKLTYTISPKKIIKKLMSIEKLFVYMTIISCKVVTFQCIVKVQVIKQGINLVV